jgi:hypothetical protein
MRKVQMEDKEQIMQISTMKGLVLIEETRDYGWVHLRKERAIRSVLCALTK